MSGKFDIDNETVKYKLTGPISSGSFGIVYKATTVSKRSAIFGRNDQNVFAVKHIILPHFADVQEDNEYRLKLTAKTERITKLMRLTNPHIVRIYASAIKSPKTFIDPTRLEIVMEYCSGGNLADILKGGPLPYSKVRLYGEHILDGLEYLHRNGIFHTDLKPANILLGYFEDKECLKIADHDDSIHLSQQSTISGDISGPRGTRRYMSPEMKEFYSNTEIKKPGRKTDVWSFGIVVLEMAQGLETETVNVDSPSAGTASTEYQLIRPPMLRTGTIPNTSEHIINELRLFVDKCLVRDPRERHSAAHLLRDPFLAPLPQFSCNSLSHSDIHALERSGANIYLLSNNRVISISSPNGSQDVGCISDALEEIASLRLENPIVLVLRQSTLPSIPDKLRKQVAVIHFLDCPEWNSDCLHHTILANLVQISFVRCRNMSLIKGHLHGYQNIRAVLFYKCQFASVERNVFDVLQFLLLIYLCDETSLCVPEWMERYRQNFPWMFTEETTGVLFGSSDGLIPQYQEHGTIFGVRRRADFTFDSVQYLPVLTGPTLFFKLSTVLGSGTFGESHLATFEHQHGVGLHNDHLVANIRDFTNKSQHTLFSKRMNSILHLNHENIRQYYHFDDTVISRSVLLMESVAGSTLDEILMTGPIASEKVEEYSRQILHGLDFLHRRHIVHSALTTRSILVEDVDCGNNLLKITGLEIPYLIQGENKVEISQLRHVDKTDGFFMSVEVWHYLGYGEMRNHVLDPRVDIWSFGCILMRMSWPTSLFLPWDEKLWNPGMACRLADILTAKKRRSMKYNRFPNITKYDDYIVRNVREMFLNRIFTENMWTAEQLLRHPYLSLLPDLSGNDYSPEQLSKISSGLCEVKVITVGGILTFTQASMRKGKDDVLMFEQTYVGDQQLVFQRLRMLNSKIGISVHVHQSMDIKKILKDVKDQVVQLIITRWTHFDSQTFIGLDLPNLLDLVFDGCDEIKLHRHHLAGLPNIRCVSFWDSTFSVIEENIFESLPCLQHIAFVSVFFSDSQNDNQGNPSTTTVHPVSRINLRRIMFLPEYVWLRQYLSENPHLVTAKAIEEVWKIGSTSNFPYPDMDVHVNERHWLIFELHWLTMPRFLFEKFDGLELAERLKMYLPSGNVTFSSTDDTCILKAELHGITLKIRRTQGWASGADLEVHGFARFVHIQTMFSALVSLDMKCPLFLNVHVKVKDLAQCLMDCPIVAQNVVQLIISFAEATECSNFKAVILPNLLHLIFFSCVDVIIRKGDLTHFRTLRAMIFANSTANFIENNIFLDFPLLQFIDLDFKLVDTIAQRTHDYRFRGSDEYRWLRSFIAEHQYLVETKEANELFMFRSTWIINGNHRLDSSGTFKKLEPYGTHWNWLF